MSDRLGDICACEESRSRFSRIVRSSAEVTISVKTDEVCGEICSILSRNGYYVRACQMYDGGPWSVTFYDPRTAVLIDDDDVSRIDKAAKAGVEYDIVIKGDKK